MADRVPVDDSGTVRLLARLSPSGKLMRRRRRRVGRGRGDRHVSRPPPAAVTVTLPVTATAPAGMPPDAARPARCVRPVGRELARQARSPGRVSRTRTGVIGDVRRAGGLEARDPGLPFGAGARILVGLPDGRRDERILGHADVVAPALAGVHASAGLEQLLGADRVRRLGRAAGMQRRTRGSRRPWPTTGSTRRGGCRCRPSRRHPCS